MACICPGRLPAIGLRVKLKKMDSFGLCFKVIFYKF